MGVFPTFCLTRGEKPFWGGGTWRNNASYPILTCPWHFGHLHQWLFSAVPPFGAASCGRYYSVRWTELTGIFYGINCCPSARSAALILSPPLFSWLLPLLVEEVAVGLLPCHCWRDFQGNHRAVVIPWMVKILFLMQRLKEKCQPGREWLEEVRRSKPQRSVGTQKLDWKLCLPWEMY